MLSVIPTEVRRAVVRPFFAVPQRVIPTRVGNATIYHPSCEMEKLEEEEQEAAR
jgi:hypothetical protein